jgi:tRNA A37 threonylcarbamoyladenosine dehydratase
MGNNAIQQTLCNTTRDIIENQNANYRALHDEIVANKLEAKNDRIAELQAQVSKLQLSASQERQNAYLLNELKPCPSPSYIVPNPNCCYQYNVTPVNNCNGCY